MERKRLQKLKLANVITSYSIHYTKLYEMEITQFTYFQQIGGIELDPISVELTYGIERIAMYVQGVDHVKNIRWNRDSTWGDVMLEREVDFCRYNFEEARITSYNVCYTKLLRFL